MSQFVLLLCLIIFSGCEPKQEKDPTAITVNGIEIGINEFNEAYNSSLYTGSDAMVPKEEYLETLIQRRLLLAEAEKYGLDKEEKFLKSVEFFWQQSLLKLVIERQLRHISATIKVEEPEIKKYYEDNKLKK